MQLYFISSTIKTAEWFGENQFQRIKSNNIKSSGLKHKLDLNCLNCHANCYITFSA